MSLLNLFDPSLLGRAGTPALEFDRADGSRLTCTFGELEERSNRVAHVLRARGLQAGDRVAFFLANCVEIIDLWIAGAKLGLIVVPTNVLYRERELRHILTDAEPKAVITTKDLAGFIPAGVPVWDLAELNRDAAAQPASRISVPTTDATPVSLIYTSGTTGASKGAVLTHGNFAANGRSLVSEWRITSADRYLATLPLFHVHGLGNGVHCWVATGCHMRLTERFEHAKALAWFEDYRPTLFFGVPTIFVRLLDLPEERAKAIGRNLRLAVSGSAPLPAEVHEKFRERYGSVILERYGMTETLMNISNPYDGERRPGTVGLPLPHVQVKILDEQDQPVPEGTLGELWVRGPNVCDGYWRRPDATAAAWRDGWFRTGDIGSRAADGYITLHGRRSDLIISGGFNIYPREIEELLLEQPGVREAAVVGVKDPVRGEVPVAYLVADASVDDAKLKERLGSQLASFKLPRAYVRVNALPRTALGKIQKHLLPPMETLLNPSTASLIAFVIVILVSLTSRINVGVLAIALAWPIATILAKMPLNTLMAVFPSNLFLTLAGVTLLFGIAQKNGTLDALTRRAVRACGGVTAVLPVFFFILTAVVAGVGPGIIAASALVAPLAMSVGSTAGVPLFLMALMVGNGANAGNLSPFSAVGLIVKNAMLKAGTPYDAWQVFTVNCVAHVLVGIGAYFAFGGLKLMRQSRVVAPAVAEPPLTAQHWQTVAAFVIWVVGVVAFDFNPGLLGFTVAAILILAGAVDDGSAVNSIPWPVIVMVCGVSVMVGVLERTGGMDLFTTLLSKITTPKTANGMMAFVTGVISTYSSTSGVVYPAFIPTVPGLVQKLGGGDPLQITLSINVGAAIVDVSPLSTTGALCIAALPFADRDKAKVLFRQMLIWGFSMTIVGALFGQFCVRFFV